MRKGNVFWQISLVLSFVFILSGFLWAYLSFKSYNETLILHYSSDDRINWTGHLSDLVPFWLTMFVAIALNFGIAKRMEKRDLFVARLLEISSILISLLIFVVFAAIIFANT